MPWLLLDGLLYHFELLLLCLRLSSNHYLLVSVAFPRPYVSTLPLQLALRTGWLAGLIWTYSSEL